MSKQGIVITFAAFAVVLLAGYGVYSIFRPHTVDVAHDVLVEVPQIKEVTKIQRIKVPIKEVQVIEKTKLVKEVELPEWVKRDANQQVIATGRVMPERDRGEVEAVTTLNTQTGESQMLMRQKDRALFGLPNEKEIGLGYGINSKGQTGVTIYGRWDVLRIGSVVIHAYGEANQNGDARIEARAGYRF